MTGKKFTGRGSGRCKNCGRGYWDHYSGLDCEPPMASEIKPEDERILEIAHRTASTYAHRSDPSYHSYGFVRHTLLDFARKVLAEASADQVRAAVLEAKEQEREACAQVAESRADGLDASRDACLYEVALAIRSGK